MRIGVDGNEANLENRVGVNQYAAELLCALEKLPQANEHEWIIYLNKSPLDHLPKERSRWNYRVTGGILGRLKAVWQAKPDVYFAPTHYLPPFLPCPAVMAVMDLGYLKFPKQFKLKDFIQLKCWTYLSLVWAKKVIAISESTKKEITKNYPWTRNKITVTHLGYDKQKYKYRKTKKEDYILYIGTLKPSKNVEGLVDAFNELITHHSSLITKYRLVIAGKKGWLFESIFEKVKKLGIGEKVEFKGFVSENEKPKLLSRAKVFVSPSFTEGFGIPALEAMAVGTPVVVSNIGSYPEVVGNAGILVDPYSTANIAEAIQKVVSASTAGYNKMVREGLGQAEKFSWERTARQTLEVLTYVH